MSNETDHKMKALMQQGKQSAVRAYRDLVYGDTSLLHFIFCESLTFCLCGMPGALGLFLRSKLYPLMFKEVGGKLVVGKNVTLRHAHKITLGRNVIIDDNAVVDAKGKSNVGITIGNDVYIGRNTIVYCKNGDIEIDDSVNLSSNCQLFSSNKLHLKQGSVIGAFSYFLSGGEYDLNDPTPLAQQSGMCTKGPLTVGENVWIGAHVCVLDGADVGDHCAIGAGAVVNKPIPNGSISVGVPAKVITTREVSSS